MVLLVGAAATAVGVTIGCQQGVDVGNRDNGIFAIPPIGKLPLLGHGVGGAVDLYVAAVLHLSVFFDNIQHAAAAVTAAQAAIKEMK